MSLNLADPVVEEIVTVRVSLLFNFPFFGTLALRLNIVDASRWCKTMTTDGKNIYYNRDWVKTLSRPKLHFALTHTVLHCVYDHLGRRGNRDKQLWDMSTDYIVNYTLVKENIGEPIEKGLLYDEKFTDEMSVEEVYKILEQNSTKIQIPFDQHMDLGSDQRDENGQSVSVTVMGDGNGPPQLTEADIEKLHNEMKAAVINAAQQNAGKLPGGIQRLLENLTEPKLNWRQLITAHIQSLVKDDYTFTRFSKKTWGLGGKFLIPGQNFLDTIDILCCVDTSGSITDDILRTFLSEVKGIIEVFPQFTLRFMTWDTRVYNYTEFTPSNIDELLNGTYSFDGGGGTSPACIWEYMDEHNIET